MATIRALQAGDSVVLPVPADMAYEAGTELTISRSGDVITVFPKKKRTGSMAEMIAALRALPTPSEIEQREPIELPDRD